MILSDQQILQEIENGTIVIKPFNRKQLGSNSYDVCLSKYLAVYTDDLLDAKQDNEIQMLEIGVEGFVLQPNRLYLGTTVEYTETHKHVPFLEGKSSTGRLGINIHATAGKGDVGFCNHWTLEISVLQSVRVYASMPIGQLIYHEVQGDVINPYNTKQNAKYTKVSKYPQSSKMFKNLK
jgi:dCTP deaminase